MPPGLLQFNHPRVLELTPLMGCLKAAIFQHELSEGTAYELEVQVRAGETDFLSSQSYRRGKNFPERSLIILSGNITKNPSPRLKDV